MTTYNTLYTSDQIEHKAADCAAWIDKITSNNKDVVLCPILQSSFMFLSVICKHLKSTPSIDFCGVTNHSTDGTMDELYLYKGVDISLYDGNTAIIIDILCSTGTTMDFVKKFLLPMGARKVYTASLLCRQFSKFKPDWTGYTVSDEYLVGYGLDSNSKYRTLNYIAYE